MNSQNTQATQQQSHPGTTPVMVTGKDRTKRLVRAGIFSFIGLIILVLGVFVIGDKQKMFSDTFAVYTHFKSVEGLKSGALVMLNGIKIGVVNKVQLKMDTSTFVRVDMVLDGDYHDYIRTSTYATIDQQGLIGDKLITLNMADNAAPMVGDGAYLPSIPPTNYLAIVDDARNIVKNAQNITGSIDTLLLRFRKGEGTLGKLLTDEAAYNNLVGISAEAEKLFAETGRQFSEMSTTLNNATKNVDNITLETQKLVADIGQGKGTFGALLYDRSLYDSLETLVGNMSVTANSASFAAREFGINMRGLRSSWLVGGLFSGGEDEIKTTELQNKLIEIRLQELQRQEQLLKEREQELLKQQQQSRR
jgi:phospholipid/cholesterol/gamma-HCH transport system substrate-binding protein